ncbi:hypothetical protein KSF_064410 [Reticulibacter mediterranei]|uniref:Alpha-L-rhamnosidase C-terminal domain-containing protein n=1 Tax=Reticulibacter mediterranei TaxID=2778369 RepID=A0A8J3IM01_9CHLR|nr:alpha-L-rhamnosidase C-terminal domain-containing protein [Reticulibacter mediterranei]GHO96393.1 hypothetical protein KSF_064410 [Reticulibacter mediterranei]
MSTSSLRVRDLRCDYQLNPLGFDWQEPCLSWRLDSDQRGVAQSAYQIQVRDGQSDLWDSGKVRSEQSLHIPYHGPALSSRRRCIWRVRVWDRNDRPSDWSDTSWWEMGLLHTTDWLARWIEPDWDEDPTVFNPCPYLRVPFILRAQPVGEIAIHWHIDGEHFQFTVTVPTNTTATVVIPTRLGREITEGKMALSSVVEVRGVRCEQEATCIEIGSGMYTFTGISHS